MPADVIEPADRRLTIARNDQTFASDFLDKIISRPGDLALVTDYDPSRGKNSGLFLGKDFRRNKVPLRQSLRAWRESISGLTEGWDDGRLHSIRVSESNAPEPTLNLPPLRSRHASPPPGISRERREHDGLKPSCSLL